MAAKKGDHNPAVNDLLEQAQTLRDEKAAVYEGIDGNRQLLRNYAKTGLLSKEQKSAIEEFYPKPKGKDEPKDEAAKDTTPATATA